MESSAATASARMEASASRAASLEILNLSGRLGCYILHLDRVFIDALLKRRHLGAQRAVGGKSIIDRLLEALRAGDPCRREYGQRG
jgi:hypothetical protein